MMLSEQTAEMDPGVRATIPVALFAVMSYIMSSYFIHRYKRSTGKAPPLHETALTTLFGILGGGLIMFFTKAVLQIFWLHSSIRIGGHFQYVCVLFLVLVVMSLSLSLMHYCACLHSLTRHDI